MTDVLQYARAGRTLVITDAFEAGSISNLLANRGLADGFQYKFSIHNESTIQSSAKKSKEIIEDFQPHLVVYMTGIWNLVMRSRDNGLVVLDTDIAKQALPKSVNAMLQVIEKAYAITRKIDNQCKIVIFPWIGIDLNSQIAKSDARHSVINKQTTLDNTLAIVNKRIEEYNATHSLVSPSLPLERKMTDKLFYKCDQVYRYSHACSAFYLDSNTRELVASSLIDAIDANMKLYWNELIAQSIPVESADDSRWKSVENVRMESVATEGVNMEIVPMDIVAEDDDAMDGVAMESVGKNVVSVPASLPMKAKPVGRVEPKAQPVQGNAQVVMIDLTDSVEEGVSNAPTPVVYVLADSRGKTLQNHLLNATFEPACEIKLIVLGKVTVNELWVNAIPILKSERVSILYIYGGIWDIVKEHVTPEGLQYWPAESVHIAVAKYEACLRVIAKEFQDLQLGETKLVFLPEAGCDLLKLNKVKAPTEIMRNNQGGLQFHLADFMKRTLDICGVLGVPPIWTISAVWQIYNGQHTPRYKKYVDGVTPDDQTAGRIANRLIKHINTVLPPIFLKMLAKS